MNEEGNEQKHDQEMRAANPLDVDDTRDPSHENVQDTAAFDQTEQHQPGEALQGHQRENGNVSERCARWKAFSPAGSLFQSALSIK
jgi:hypothetical protein